MNRHKQLLRALLVVVLGGVALAAPGKATASAAETGCTTCQYDRCPANSMEAAVGCLMACQMSYNTCHSGECAGGNPKWHCTDSQGE